MYTMMVYSEGCYDIPYRIVRIGEGERYKKVSTRQWVFLQST